MDVREKLVELLKTNACPSPFMCDPACRYYGLGDCFTYRFADHLISNGVTVHEWISVDDRLPEESGYYLVFADIGRNEVLSYSKKYQAFNAYDDSYSESNVIPVTHWMPMPNPPKGE